MANTRTRPVSSEDGCAHAYMRAIGPYLKCTACGEVTAAAEGYDPNCPNCEWELHRCGHCGSPLDHSETHDCPKAYGT